MSKVKNLSEPYYLIKRVLTFVSGVQESVLLDFISQNIAKILHKVKTCQNCLYQKFPYKNEKTCISFIFFSIFALILSAISFDYFEIVAIVKMRSVVEKEVTLNVHEIVLVIVVFVRNIINKLLIYSAVAITTHFCITHYKFIELAVSSVA